MPAVPIGVGVQVDHSVTVPRAVHAVFEVLSDPRHLASWLTDRDGCRNRLAVEPVADRSDTGPTFALRLGECDTLGELIAYEPPSVVAYRLVIAERFHVVRITCSAHNPTRSAAAPSPMATRVDIHQTDPAGLSVDLAALNRALLEPNLTR